MCSSFLTHILFYSILNYSVSYCIVVINRFVAENLVIGFGTKRICTSFRLHEFFKKSKTKDFFLKDFFFPAALLAFLQFQESVDLICVSFSAFSHISEPEFPSDGRAWRELV